MTTLLLDPSLRRARIVGVAVAASFAVVVAMIAVCVIDLRFGDRPQLRDGVRSATGQSSRRRPAGELCPAAGQDRPLRGAERRSAREQAPAFRRPIPTAELTAFVDPSIAGAAESLKQHAAQITTVAFTGLLLGDDGQVIDRLDRRMLRLAHHEGLPAMALLSLDERRGDRLADRLRLLAHDRLARRRLVEKLVQICDAEHLRGIHLDLERVGEWRDLEPIAADLAHALRRAQLELDIDVPPGIDAPLTSLAQLANHIVIMAYDEFDASTLAGPIASDAFVESALRSASAHVPAAKLTAALALHGYEWISGKPGRRISFDEANHIAHKAQVVLHKSGTHLHAQFQDGDQSREVWLAGSASVLSQARIAAATRIRSLALWRLGGEDPNVWTALEAAENPASERASPSRRRMSRNLPPDLADSRSRPHAETKRVSARRPDRIRDRPREDGGTLTSSAPVPVTHDAPALPRRSAVAIVIEGGPDPRSTPRILAELAQQQVPATFFVSGIDVLRTPALIERIFRAGHVIGNNGFSHTSLNRLGDTRLALELETTSRLVELLVFRRPLLLHRPKDSPEIRSTAVTTAVPPDSGSLDGLLDDARSTRPMPPDAAELVRQALREAEHSGIIVLHDDPNRYLVTQQVLRQVMVQLRAQGIQLVSLADFLEKQRDEVMPPAPARLRIGERLTCILLAGALALSRALSALLWLSLGLFVTRALLTMTLATIAWRRVPKSLPSSPLPSISVLIAVFNDKLNIEKTIDSVLASDVPLELVIIDDGSTDDTMEQLSRRYRRESRMRLLRQSHAGRTAALLSGFAVCKTEVVVTLDAGALFETDTVRKLVEPLRDPSVGAVSGTARVGDLGNALCRWQALELFVHHAVGQGAWGLLGALPNTPLPFGAWRRRAVLKAGGFSPVTLTADLDLIMALCRHGWRAVHAVGARATINAPTTLRLLVRQRLHSSFGILQTLWRYRPSARQAHSRDYGRRSWWALLFNNVLMPLSTLPALGAVTAAALTGNFRPGLQAGLVLLALELAQLGLVRLLAGRDGSVSTGQLLLSLMVSQLVYRPLRLAIMLRSIGRLLDGIPVGEESGPARAALAYVASRRALTSRSLHRTGPRRRETS